MHNTAECIPWLSTAVVGGLDSVSAFEPSEIFQKTLGTYYYNNEKRENNND